MKDILTVSLDFELREKLDILAKITSRSKSSLVVEAMKQYLVTNEWKIYAVREGLKQADRGQLIPHETIRQKWEKKHAHSLD